MLAICLAIGALPLAAISALAVSPDVVISQVYGGGGNSGATFKNDFIELYNRGTTAIDVTGWSVQYASAAGTTWQVTPLSGTIGAGRYFLVKEAAGAGGTTELPAPNATGTIAMSATAGKVALVRGSTAVLTGSGCPFAANVVDFVGYGAANCAEGAPTGTLSNTTAALRNGGGAIDTDSNAADFTIGPPNPRNTPPPGDAAPSVTSTAPASGASGVARDASITVAFSEPVNVVAGWYAITCTASGSHAATQSGGPSSYTLDPTEDFTAAESCTVRVNAGSVTDTDPNDPPDNMAADHSFTFTIASPPMLIREIQGAGHTSPKAGQTVSGVYGIVTAVRTASSRGFWLQDPTPDADDATSEGIYVFTGSTPTVSVGQAVRVSGTVTEFGTSPALTLTEITGPTVVVVSSGNPLPSPIVIGAGGRVPPAGVIDDDGLTAFDPATDGIDFYESLEGMLVQVNGAVAVSATNRFGELWVLGDAGSGATGRTSRGGIVIAPSDFNPERILLDDELFKATAPMPSAHVGATLSGPQIGPLDYGFNNFRIQVLAAPVAVASTIARESTRAQVGDELAIATFNVENLDAADPQTKFDALARLIATNLAGPDLVVLEEIQDNDGPASPSPTAADQTFARLIAAIQAASGPTYDYRQIDPAANADGGEPNGNIRVAFLFRTDRGLSFVDAPGAGPLTANSVNGSGVDTHLAFSPGRIAPTDPAFTNSRKPLAGELRWRGQTLFVIANHFNSKGGDQPLFGRVQPPVQSSQAQRLQQAAIVNAFVDEILAADAQALVVVAGDINDFQFSAPMGVLRGSPPVLEPLIERLPESERYSYVFEGNSQTLDHILVSAALGAKTLEIDAVHVNAEFYDQISDHDPQVVRISLPNLAPVVDAGGPYTVAEGSTVTLSATGSDPERGPVTYAWDLDGDGTFETPGQTVPYAADDGPAVRMVTVRVTDDRDQSTTDTATVTIDNVAPAAEAGGPRGGPWGLPVTFDGSATDPSSADAASLSYAWSFGGTTPSASTSFPAPGSYTVTLTVTDKDGGSGSDTASAEIGRRTSAVSCTAESATYGFAATVHGTFRDTTSATNAALGGRTLTFTLGTSSASAVTDPSGNASTTLPNTLPPGTHQITVAFAQDTHYEGSTAACALTIQGSYGRVSGIALRGSDWSASFHVKSDAEDVKGELTFRRDGTKFKAKTFDVIGISGNTAFITGSGEDGTSFTLSVEDNGDGAGDRFRLSIGGVPQTGDGSLTHGDIRIAPDGDGGTNSSQD